MSSSELYIKINHLPAELKSEVNDFVDFLITKKKVNRKLKKPVFGCAKGKIKIAPDFDEPLDIFKEYM